jgi:hypothetical protein
VDDGKSWTTVTKEDAESDTPAEDDTEFDALKPFSMQHSRLLLPWQSYKDWLRLTIIYFDASFILSDHVKQYPVTVPASDKVDIMILAPSRPSEDMLTWKNLLNHKLYFPELLNTPGQPSAEQLIDFLTSDFGEAREASRNKTEKGNNTGGKGNEGSQLEEQKGFSIEQVIKGVTNLKESTIATNFNMDAFTEDINLVAKQMTFLTNCSSPGWVKYTKAIRQQLVDLKDHSLTPVRRRSDTEIVLEMLNTLQKHSILYQMLKKDTPLSLGVRFSGTRHCEVCMASFICLSGQPGKFSSQYSDILSEFKVSHIFMLCLSVCQILQYREVDQP